MFERDCGATTGFSTQVSILNPGEALPPEGGNVFVGDHDEGVLVRWKSTDHLVVVVPYGTRIFVQVTRVRGVTVSFE